MGATFQIVEGKLADVVIADLATAVQSASFIKDPNKVLRELERWQVGTRKYDGSKLGAPGTTWNILQLPKENYLVLFGTALQIVAFFSGLHTVNIAGVRSESSPVVAYWTDLSDEETEGTKTKVLLAIGGRNDIAAEALDDRWENLPVVRKYESAKALWLDEQFNKKLVDAVNVILNETYAPYNEL